MSQNIKEEDLKEKAPASEAKPEEKEEDKVEDKPETDPTLEQDPLKNELDKVQNKKVYTKEEKLLYKRKQIDEELKALGVDTDEPTDKDLDNTPVTLGMLKKMEAEKASKTALQLADEIPNETEKALVKYHLENSIKSTGNPTDDLALAQAIVNSKKNTQIVEEQQRKPVTKAHSSASGAPAKEVKELELDANEIAFTKAPFNMTKEAVLKLRQN